MLETLPRGTSFSFVETDWVVFDILWISQRATRGSEISQRYYYYCKNNTPVIEVCIPKPIASTSNYIDVIHYRHRYKY